MDILQTEHCSNAAAQPMDAVPARAAGPQLLRASQIDRDFAPAAPLARVLAWVRDFLSAPHPQLGRKGPVCPFVPVSLKLDTIWMAEIPQADLSVDSIAAIINEFRDVFLATEPTGGPDAIYKAFLVVFPALGAGGAAFVDQVQGKLKQHFVDRGLMLGEFHAANESPGLRNPDFRPLRSPLPMLAIRHMVESDLPFLQRQSYQARQRSSFLRSYLLHLREVLSPARFEYALGELLSAERELWMAAGKAGEASLAATVLPDEYETAAEPAGVNI